MLYAQHACYNPIVFPSCVKLRIFAVEYGPIGIILEHDAVKYTSIDYR